MMKPKIIVLILFLWVLAACTPDAVVSTPEVESRPTVIATALAEATATAVSPTPEPQPTPTMVPETATTEPAAFTPHFDRFLPFAETEGGSNSLTGLIQQGDGWQLATIPYPANAHSIDSDYAPATNRLLAWRFAGGAGPGNIAVGSLSIIDVATEVEELVVPENVVAAGWAPNGLDFAYILANDETYELRWRTSDGDDRLLAVDVPHSLRVSPDGRTVAFTRESYYSLNDAVPGLYVVEIETGVETQISTLDRAGYGGAGPFYKPHWTPDSSQLFLYAAADDDRAPTPHPAGYVWAALDGSFSHFLPESAFLELYDKPLREPEYYRCLDSPSLLAANAMVMGVGECQPFSAMPEASQPAYFTLNPQTGAVALANLLPVPSRAQLLTWDLPGDSVLLLDEGVVFSQSVTAVATASPPPTINRCLDAAAVAQPLPPAKPAGLLYSEAGNLKLWQEGMETAVSLTTSGDVPYGHRSLDGALVAFVRTVPQETAELWVVSADGQNERRLATVSLADYLTEAEEYVIDAQLRYTWLPESHKVAYWLSPTLDALGSLPQEAVTVVDADSGEAVPLFAGGEVWRWWFSFDGRFAATFIQDGVRLIDIATGQLLYDLAVPGSGSEDQTVSFSPDGRFLATFAADKVALIDTSNGNLALISLDFVRVGAGHSAFEPTIEWLPDGRSFWVAATNMLDVWNNPEATFTLWQVDTMAKTAIPQHTFTGFPFSVRFSANGRYLAYWKLASGQSNARELYLADLESGETALYDRGQAVSFVDWHPNGVQFTYWFGGAKGPLLGSLCGEPIEIPGPGSDIHQLYWQTNDQFIWYTGQPDNPDDYFNSAGDWTLFRGSLNGETTQLWQYRGLYPSY